MSTRSSSGPASRSAVAADRGAGVTADGGWRRRARGLAVAALAGLGTMGSAEAMAAGTPPAAKERAGPAQREARRRWALARMDEVAQDRLRCRERFKKPPEVEECQRRLDREFRRYNEIYLDAARE